MDRASVGNGELYFEARGEGTPVVLLHGNMVDSRMFDDQFDALARHHHVIRYDARGFWRSSPPLEPYSGHEDLHALVNVLGVDRPHLVGVSMGAYFALDYAIQFPEDLRSMTLVPGGFEGYEYKDPSFMESFAALSEAASSGDTRRATEILFEFSPMRAATGIPQVREKLEEMVAGYSWIHFTQEDPYRDAPFKAIERLSDIRVPTLVISPALDIQDHLDQAVLLADAIPGGTLVKIEGAGHMVNMERPARFNEAVLNFLARIDG